MRGPVRTSSACALVSGAEYLLLDFDGPVCDIFAGLPGRSVAASLRHTLAVAGVNLPAPIQRQDDPLEIFRFSARLGHDLNFAALKALTALELKAIRSARPTKGAAELIAWARAAGKTVAVISNNSVDAVTAYLQRHSLMQSIDYISARAAADPALLKPNPYLIRQALALLNAAARDAVLIGDSVTDIEAAAAAGISAIGYANRPEKIERLSNAGANAVIESMTELLPADHAHAEAFAQGDTPAIVAAVVTSPLGVLVGRRNDGKPPWTFIAGEIEPGETPADAAVREVKEETGLQISPAHIIGSRVHPQTGRTVIYTAARPAHGTKVFVGDAQELAEVRWVSLAQADELMGGTIFEPVRIHLQTTLPHRSTR